MRKSAVARRLFLACAMACSAGRPGDATERVQTDDDLAAALMRATQEVPEPQKLKVQDQLLDGLTLYMDYRERIQEVPPGSDDQRKLIQEMRDSVPRYESVAEIAHQIFKSNLIDIVRQVDKPAGPKVPNPPAATAAPVAPEPAPSKVAGLPAGSSPALREAEKVTGLDVRIDPENPDSRADHGTVLLYLGATREAFDDLGAAYRLGKRDGETLTLYGRAAYLLGDNRLAAESFRRARTPEAESLLRLVEGRSSRASLPSAFAEGESPPEPVATAGLRPSGPAQPALWDGARPRPSAEDISAAASGQAQAPPSRVQQSAALTRQAATALTVKDYEAAHGLASQAVELNDRNAQAWNFRAIASNRLGRYQDAVQDASFALGVVPGNAAALQTRSWAFNKQKRFSEALADANYTLEKEPDNAFAYDNRAFALAGMGNREGALESLKRAAELDPRFRDKFEQALQAPAKSDLLFLFDEGPAAKTAGTPAAPASALLPKRFLRLVVVALSGGILVALGVLHIVSASWRERVRMTIRRVLAPGERPSGGPALPGAFWQRFERIGDLGAGGMGLVYEALDKSLNRRVAVKKMRDEIRSDPTERSHFVTEARMVAALHHPNIVDIYSIVEDDEDVYLVFEFVPGRTLADLLKERGRLGFDEARLILKGACEAVECAHRQRIIHRDLKPSNIMVTEEGRVKVMDFGVARQAKDSLTKMSMTNTITGTPPYMAPEQEQGGVRKESDVYALGVCLYEMLCGKLPFAGVGAGMLLNKLNGRHAPVSSQVPDALPPGLDGVIAKALAPDPELRYGTASELMAAVEALSVARLG